MSFVNSRHDSALFSPIKTAKFVGVAALLVGGWSMAVPQCRARTTAASPHPSVVVKPVASAQSTPGNASVKIWLQRLDQRGKTLKNFSADIRMCIHHLRTDEKDINIGKIWYQRSKGRTRFDIRFNILVVDGAIARRHADHDIVFDGRWLIDRDGAAKIFRKTRIAPPGKRFNPLKLGQGPIPIPIGQNPKVVEKEFFVSLIKPTKKEGNLIHLRLVPRDRHAFTFRRLELWIDPELDLPVRILRIDPDSTPTLAVLTHVKINTPFHHNFHLSPPPANAGWTIDIQKK